MTENEMIYQLVKVLLDNMVHDSILSSEDAEFIRSNAQKDFNPIIGGLDEMRNKVWQKK